jgi:aspartyl-tRNA(Asn)/glutamyl-tRNA(Gln) amidotransferase subunit C
MKITKDEVVYTADLARLDLDEDSIDRFADQIGNILEYVNTLNSVDTEGIVPTSHAIFFLSNAFREDEVKESMGADKALANAPEKEDGNFIVPKVINS